MKHRGVKLPGRHSTELNNGIFVLSRCCGLFPFTIDHGKPILSQLRLALSFIFLIITYTLDGLLPSAYETIYASSRKYAYYGPLAGMMMIAPTSLIVLSLSTKKLSRAVETLHRVDVILPHAFPLPRLWKISLSFYVSFSICLITFESYFLEGGIYKSPGVYLYYFTVCHMIFIVSQFSTLLSSARLRYKFLYDTLETNRAEKWTYCHDLLGQFSRDISDSYAPQLVLVTLIAFCYTVSNSYNVIKKFDDQQYRCLAIDLIAWSILFVSLAWFICYQCRETSLKAKKFDNTLYQLIIYDKTKTLVNNKRIRLHFRTIKSEEFSAMGFFRFDYPLLCSMISSATTYVVIMVQFS